MKQKILIYVYALGAGGAERVVVSLASGLSKRGHDVTLATDFDRTEAATFLSLDVHRLDLGRSHGGSTRRLAAYLRQEKPDVTLSATGVSNLKHAIAAVAAGRARRAVLTFHGDFRAERGILSRAGNALSFALTRLTGRSVFVSDALKASFIRLGASSARSVRIYNPVEIGAVRSLGRKNAAGCEILSVGRLVPAKGFDTILNALARLARSDARLTILGDGPERGRLAEQAATLGLTEQVTFVGWVDDPTPWYARADCLVLASQREAFGNVVVEALGAGLPVVATDCGGPREILQDGRYGALVPVGDAAAMVTAIAHILREPGDPAPRRDRAAAFSVTRAIEGYERLIEEVIAAAP